MNAFLLSFPHIFNAYANVEGRLIVTPPPLSVFDKLYKREIYNSIRGVSYLFRSLKCISGLASILTF